MLSESQRFRRFELRVDALFGLAKIKLQEWAIKARLRSLPDPDVRVKHLAVVRNLDAMLASSPGDTMLILVHPLRAQALNETLKRNGYKQDVDLDVSHSVQDNESFSLRAHLLGISKKARRP